MTERFGEWRTGWPVVLGAVAGMMTVAAPSVLTGMVMEPLLHDFGWSRSQVATNILITALCSLIFAPFAGNLINRYGIRSVALASFATTAIGFCAVAASGPALWTWYGSWLVYGILSVTLGPMLWSSAISSLFDRQRGMALSIGLSGSGFAFSVWPPIVAPLMEYHDWRAAYLALALAALLVMLPLNFFALRTLGRRSGAAGTAAGPTQGATEPWGVTLGEALRTSLFWRFAACFVLAAAINGSLMIHFFPILSEIDLSAQEAAYLTAAMGPAMIVGRILTGWLMDRLFAPFVVAAALSLPAGTLLIFMLAPVPGAIMVGSILEGLSVGAMTGSLAYLAGRYFGLRHYPSILGVLIGIFGISMGVIPSLVGHFVDLTGSYSQLFPVLLAGIVPMALLLVTLGRYPARAAG